MQSGIRLAFFSGVHTYFFTSLVLQFLCTLSPHIFTSCVGYFAGPLYVLAISDGGLEGVPKSSQRIMAPPIFGKGEKDERWRYDVVDSLILGSDLSMLLRMVYRDE
jgi:hypothetical protein